MLYCKKSNYSAKEIIDIMKNNEIFVSELSTSRHIFNSYHFCRGNSTRRKTRLGIIQKGMGTYIYLSKKLPVAEGDIVFIPENIYCYSEWHGSPSIEVTYISCFMHYDAFCYEPQKLVCDEDIKKQFLQISSLLAEKNQVGTLEAYSLFYHLLTDILPMLKTSNIAFDKTLQTAVEYITKNWDKTFSISELAKSCCVSESTLYHLFQRELGETPIRFLNSIKINIAIEHLENSRYSVSTISKLAGFNSENHFRRIFFDFTGMTPREYRKNK